MFWIWGRQEEKKLQIWGFDEKKVVDLPRREEENLSYEFGPATKKNYDKRTKIEVYEDEKKLIVALPRREKKY